MNIDLPPLTHWALEPTAQADGDFESAYTLTLEPAVRTRRTTGAPVFGNVSLALGPLPRGADRITVRRPATPITLTLTFE